MKCRRAMNLDAREAEICGVSTICNALCFKLKTSVREMGNGEKVN